MNNKNQTNNFLFFTTSLARHVFIVFILLYLALFILDVFFGGLVSNIFTLWIILAIVIISGVISIFKPGKFNLR